MTTDPLQTDYFAGHLQSIFQDCGVVGVDNGLFLPPGEPFSAHAAQTASGYSWIESQVGQGIGMNDFSLLRSKVFNALDGRKADVEASVSCHPHPDFDVLDLHSLGFQNGLAKTALDDGRH